MKKIALLGLMLALITAGAVAQEEAEAAAASHPAPTPAQIAAVEVKFLTALLDLDQTQQTQALGFYTTAETTKATLTATLPALQTALTKAILAYDGGTAATATLNNAAAAIGAVTGGITAAQALAEGKLNDILNPTQKTKFAALLQFGMAAHGPGAPGGGGHGHVDN